MFEDDFFGEFLCEYLMSGQSDHDCAYPEPLGPDASDEHKAFYKLAFDANKEINSKTGRSLNDVIIPSAPTSGAPEDPVEADCSRFMITAIKTFAGFGNRLSLEKARAAGKNTFHYTVKREKWENLEEKAKEEGVNPKTRAGREAKFEERQDKYRQGGRLAPCHSPRKNLPGRST